MRADDAGPVHRNPRGIQSPPPRQREGRSGRPDQKWSATGSTLLLSKCTGDADRRFLSSARGARTASGRDSVSRAAGVSLFSRI
jgi:hypothetical protein